MWNKFKTKVYNGWNRFKLWVISILASIGLIVMPAIGVDTGFTWTNATTYSDGSPMLVSEIEETRLYCDGVIVGTIVDGSENITVDLAPGVYDCYATHVANGIESVPSNTVQKTVLQPPPSPPANLQ